jgi:hypothetical protein
MDLHSWPFKKKLDQHVKPFNNFLILNGEGCIVCL